ncbi:MAG TPA: 2-C-methyl-D-erythritol 2,4-cyclodiphosphate synthase [Bacillota bacterium]|nr:2-C-methyl-D-erythritol 2,4-cyclodiphosphate synthase [Bacillota bacterium]HPJ23395.1 2-C-methyl-D-erythritol 2,4-cyclodiphosphate synthase [Bacillota bacterium]
MIRIGFSKDVHPMVEGHPFVLGGVKINHHKGSKGHSDGDCLLHAIAESLLGAMALGDLGKFFPDTEPKYKNYDSKLILKEVFDYIYASGYEISNLDCMVSLEKPLLRPYIKKMRETIAKILKCDKSQVSVKATTFEGLGIVGKEEAIICEAIVLLESAAYMVD